MRQHLRFGLLLILSLTLAGCNCGEQGDGNPNGFGGECESGTDFDGDGYGAGCEAGPDCNDSNPDYNVDCCWDGNDFEGCPCSGDEEVECFDGDPNLIGVGVCTAGTRTCAEGVWGACEGGISPSREYCDSGNDNDCDGSSDEGVLTACGNCMPGCDQGDFGGDDPLATEDDDPENVDQDGTGLNDEGDIVLDAGSTRAYFLWIANDGEGTVSKIDTRTGLEVARYPSVVKTHGRLIEGNCGAQACQPGKVPDWNEGADGGNAHNRPSRTSIDGFDDCWVANRAHSGNPTDQQSTVTKIINNTGVDETNVTAEVPAAQSSCVDFDGDGIITTSRDLDGDGQISLTATGADQEFFPDDECVAATVMVGDYTEHTGARALAVDAGAFDADYGGPNPNDPGRAWVGMWSEEAFYRVGLSFTGTTPVADAVRVPTTGTLPGSLNPYGAAIDGGGVVWAVDHAGNSTRLVGINTNSADFSDPAQTYVDEAGSGNDYHEPPAPGNNYGIVIDLNDRIWIGGWSGQVVHRYDPATGDWTAFDHSALTDGNVNSRGMALDLNGYIYTALSSSPGRFVRFKADGTGVAGDMQVFNYGGQAPDSASGPIGVGIDFDGQLWLINRSSDNASKIAIDTTQDLDADGIVGDPVGGASNLTVSNHPVGDAPYTYSDFTGLSLRNVVRPRGLYAQNLQGCPDGTEADWQAITFDSETPVGTQIQVCVRVGSDKSTLANQQPCYGTWTSSPIDLDAPIPSDGTTVVPHSEFLRIEFTLISADRMSSPVLKGFNVQWTCPDSEIE